MAYRVRLFVDYWNFQLASNDRLSPERCDWPQLPVQFVHEAQAAIARAGITEPLGLEETRVYASYNPGRTEDAPLRRWLNEFLDQQTSFRVFATERRDKTAKIYCRECQKSFTSCP